MNPLTQVKRTQVINRKEAALGIADEASWHAKYKDSAYVFVGGVPFDLTEGDLLAVFAQYGEVVDVNLVRDKATGKSRGFAFVAYEDQRSTILAVDNLNGAKILGRIIRVDHVSKYKKKEEVDEEEEQQKREARGVCYAFQKGECNRGASCKFSHDEQRNSNTGWGSKEESNGRWGHDRYCGPPKSHKNFPSTTTEQRIPDRTKELRSVEREGRSLRSEAYGGRDSSMRPGDRSMKDEDRYGHDRSPERSRSERQRNDDQYGRDRSPERSRSERRRNDDQYGRNRSPERLRSERHDSEAKHDDDHKWPRHDRDSSSRYRRGDEDAEERRWRSKR